MVFWLIAAVLTLAACLAVLLPLTARARLSPARGDLDVAIYREQLDELSQDEARGAIGGDEAREARAEIGRRIIRSAGMQEDDAKLSGRQWPRRAVVAVAVLSIPIVSWALYGELGSPDLPGQPLAARMAANPSVLTIDELVARAEAHLANEPDDGKGWDVLAPIYARMGRAEDAVIAYQHAIRLAGESADREAGLGEALAYAGGGRITPEAKAAFDKAIALEPDNAKARFYLATALAQDDKLAEAGAAWQAMLPTLPESSPWRGAVQDALGEVQRRTAPATAQVAPGPTSDDIAAAASMPTADRNAMVESMVAGLDQKLREQPDNADGWIRLVRSYVVLGRTADARDALGRGLKALGDGNDAGKRLAALGVSLGLSATE